MHLDDLWEELDSEYGRLQHHNERPWDSLHASMFLLFQRASLRTYPLVGMHAGSRSLAPGRETWHACFEDGGGDK